MTHYGVGDRPVEPCSPEKPRLGTRWPSPISIAHPTCFSTFSFGKLFISPGQQSPRGPSFGFGTLSTTLLHSIQHAEFPLVIDYQKSIFHRLARRFGHCLPHSFFQLHFASFPTCRMAPSLRSLGMASLGLLLSPMAAAQFTLSIHTPCADCPSGVGPDPVPVTAQLQELVVCSATVGTTTTDAVAVETTGFACADAKSTFVSTSVPAVATDGSVVTTLVREVDQLITVSYSSTTSTITSTTTTTSTLSPTETVEPGVKVARRDGHRYVTKEVEVVVYDVVEYVYTSRYRDCGRHAVYGWEGSGLCSSETCGYESEYQPIYTKECHNGNCVTYECKWKFSKGSSKGYDKEVIREEFEIEYPSPFPPAPPGCENVNAYYRFYDEYLEIWVWRSSWYTVPIIFGFPTQYPPGSCSWCQLPPGWGTTVIIIPGLTPVTTTITVPTTVATQTVTVTGGAQPTNPVGPLSCPTSDRTVYTTPDGSTFLIQCGIAFTGPRINARAAEEERSIDARNLGNAGSFSGCIDLCDRTESCIAVTYFADTGFCSGYTAVTGSAPIAGASAANLISKGTSTTIATTGTSTSASAGATSNAASVSQTSGAADSSTAGEASQTSGPQPTGTGTGPAPQPTGTGTEPAPQPTGTGTEPAPQPTGTGAEPTPQPTGTGTEPAPQPTGTGTEPAPQPTGTGTEPAPQPTGTGTVPVPQPTNGGNPSTPIQINVESLENASPTTVNGQPAFSFGVPAGGTASVAGEAPIPEGVSVGDGVQITFNAQVSQSQRLQRRHLSARQNGADTGCDISASANGVTVFSSPLGDGGGAVQTFASSNFQATAEIVIAITTTCDEGASVSLLVSAIGLAVTEPISSSSTASSTTFSSTTASSTTPSSTVVPSQSSTVVPSQSSTVVPPQSSTVVPESSTAVPSESSSTVVAPETTSSSPVTTSSPTTAETTAEPTTLSTVVVESSSSSSSTTTSAAPPDPSSDPDVVPRDDALLPVLVPKRVVDGHFIRAGSKVRRRGGRFMSGKEAEGKKIKRSIPIRV
ncbi:hypothetical protein B0T11DRAFT_334024 [Plectosphaerella cucumerina]|uniref:Apple domain-containing protein n=1 Tax=Plectosphaerella cucumerina TaxID=40658 RepID=A0A8K0TNE7_9PEZI|nr:hypothetical protein B0T11DRAFT_334024 [Plectosphaerella cucumerina]